MCLFGLDLFGYKLDYEHGQRIQQSVAGEFAADQEQAYAEYMMLQHVNVSGKSSEEIIDLTMRSESALRRLLKQPEPSWKLADEYYAAGRRDMEADYKRRQREYYLKCIDEAIAYLEDCDYWNEYGMSDRAKRSLDAMIVMGVSAMHYARHFHVLG